ncbi:hypothetical protein F2Q69_00005491 [Brassica cretica]|uniref:Uncharacterized protein n=1 Tax=Brassica cretica TaxID=69181 RepID=A0A8S9PIS4_BRACR|nr:hypothetical protein F2Q69_00005491 [Brassica cretica]
MKAPDSFRNPAFWCDFHRDHGHKTEDCVALKIEVNELLKKGHLTEFLSEKAKSHLRKERTGKPTETAPVSPPRQDRLPASRFLPPGPGSLPPGLGPCLHPPASRPSDLSCLRINGNLPLIRGRHDLHHKYRFLNLKKEVDDVHDQSSSTLQPPRQGFPPRGPSSSTSSQPMNPYYYYQPDDKICSLQHVYNSTCWLRPRSPAHQRGPSMLTKAHRHIMLTVAYRQVYHLFRPCAL